MKKIILSISIITLIILSFSYSFANATNNEKKIYTFQELKDLLNYATPEEKQLMLKDYPELKYDYNEVLDILNYANPKERKYFEDKYPDLKHPNFNWNIWIISIIITWVIGLTPPIFIKFLLKKPLSSLFAATFCFLMYIINFYVFTVLLHSQNKNHPVLGIVALVSYLILTKKLKNIQPQPVLQKATVPQEIPPPLPDTKKFPYCAEDIKFEAKKCKHCGEWME